LEIWRTRIVQVRPVGDAPLIGDYIIQPFDVALAPGL
jgi:hypothetical protein